MINLLPPEHGSHIRHGRQNTKLRRWLLTISLSTAGMILFMAAGWIYMDSQSKNLARTVAMTKQQLQDQNLSQVQKQAREINNNVKIINQVLRREIRFSALIQEIGKVMPPQAVLSSLTLGKVDGAVDLSVSAKSQAAATQVAVNLSDPANNLFDKVDIVNIDCQSTTNDPYRCTATLKVLSSKDAKSRFINVPEVGPS